MAPLAAVLKPSFSERAHGEPHDRRVDRVGQPRGKEALRQGEFENRHAEQIARQHPDRRALAQGHVDAGFRKVERDLGAGIAEADDERAAALMRRGVAIGAGMQDFTAIGVHARPARNMREIRPSRRNDDNRGGDGLSRRLDRPAIAVLANGGDGRGKLRLQLKAVGVAFQIFDEIRARGIAAEGARDGQARQAGVRARRVQMQTVVMPPPRRSDLGRLLDHQRPHAGGLQPLRGGESRRPRADHHRLRNRHDTPPNADAAMKRAASARASGVWGTCGAAIVPPVPLPKIAARPPPPRSWR